MGAIIYKNKLLSNDNCHKNKNIKTFFIENWAITAKKNNTNYKIRMETSYYLTMNPNDFILENENDNFLTTPPLYHYIKDENIIRREYPIKLLTKDDEYIEDFYKNNFNGGIHINEEQDKEENLIKVPSFTIYNHYDTSDCDVVEVGFKYIIYGTISDEDILTLQNLVDKIYFDNRVKENVDIVEEEEV